MIVTPANNQYFDETMSSSQFLFWFVPTKRELLSFVFFFQSSRSSLEYRNVSFVWRKLTWTTSFLVWFGLIYTGLCLLIQRILNVLTQNWIFLFNFLWDYYWSRTHLKFLFWQMYQNWMQTMTAVSLLNDFTVAPSDGQNQNVRSLYE